MKFAEYMTRQPAPQSRRDLARRRTEQRLVAELEQAAGRRVDIGAARWPALLARLAGYGPADWQAVRQDGLGVVPEFQKHRHLTEE